MIENDRDDGGKSTDNVHDGECDDDDDCFALAENGELTREELCKQNVVSR